MPVLFERPGRHSGQLMAGTPYLQAVHVDGEGLLIGDLIPVEIMRRHPALPGTPASQAITQLEQPA